MHVVILAKSLKADNAVRKPAVRSAAGIENYANVPSLADFDRWHNAVVSSANRVWAVPPCGRLRQRESHDQKRYERRKARTLNAFCAHAANWSTSVSRIAKVRIWPCFHVGGNVAQ